MPLAFAVLALSCSDPGCLAADLLVSVVDPGGDPVRDAVAVFIPDAGFPKPKKRTVDVVQANQEFFPPVTAIAVGSTVRFPNRDSVAHHVYSFSSAKKFDLPLYTRETSPEVTFDRPGVVALGCNIHDWMSAYLYVSESPFFAVTGLDGTARVAGMPGGAGTLRVWHPRLRGDEAARPLDPARERSVAVELALRPERKRRRAPAPGAGGSYP